MTWALVALGASVGAPARFLLDRWLGTRTRTSFPWGTFTVNVLGSFTLGLVAAAAVSEETYAIAATGFCGAFTTFSTLAFETDRLAEDGAGREAVFNVILNATLGLGAVTLGWWLGAL